jgi:hypothetical protein
MEASPSLQEEALGHVALLLVEGRLLGVLEVRLGHVHPALAQGQQAGLGADGLDVGPGEVVLGLHELLEVDVWAHAHLRVRGAGGRSEWAVQ